MVCQLKLALANVPWTSTTGYGSETAQDDVPLTPARMPVGSLNSLSMPMSSPVPGVGTAKQPVGADAERVSAPPAGDRPMPMRTPDADKRRMAVPIRGHLARKTSNIRLIAASCTRFRPRARHPNLPLSPSDRPLGAAYAPAVATLRRALVLAPMTSELRPVVRYARARRSPLEGLRTFRGRVGGVDVAIARLGVGPASAENVTGLALSHLTVDHVLVCGIAGGLDPRLTKGAVVIPEVVMDLRSGHRYESAPMDGVERRGMIATADHLVTDEVQLAALRAQGVVAMEMESSGVAAACARAGVPWTTFRVIADRPDEGLTDDVIMSLLRSDGTSDVGAAVRLMILHPTRIPPMMRLALDSSRAASKAARVALGSLGPRQL